MQPLRNRPYMADPNQAYFSGTQPGSAAVRYGLTEPVPIQHQRFNPALPPDTGAVAQQQALANWRQLAGTLSA